MKRHSAWHGILVMRSPDEAPARLNEAPQPFVSTMVPISQATTITGRPTVDRSNASDAMKIVARCRWRVSMHLITRRRALGFPRLQNCHRVTEAPRMEPILHHSMFSILHSEFLLSLVSASPLFFFIFPGCGWCSVSVISLGTEFLSLSA